jgi:hypothetical protein
MGDGGRTAGEEAPRAATCRAVATGCGVAAALVGASVLAGWLFDVPFLVRLAPEWVSVKANTALGLLLAGAALARFASAPGVARCNGARAAALLAAAIRVATLLE